MYHFMRAPHMTPHHRSLEVSGKQSQLSHGGFGVQQPSPMAVALRAVDLRVARPQGLSSGDSFLDLTSIWKDLLLL